MPFDAENEAQKDAELDAKPPEPEGVVEPEPEPEAEQEAKTETDPASELAPKIDIHRPHNKAKYRLGDWTDFKIEYTGAPNKTHQIHAVLDEPGMDPERMSLHCKTNAQGKGKIHIPWELSLTPGHGKFSVWGDATNAGGGTAVAEIEYEIVDHMKAPQGDELLPAGDADDESIDEKAAFDA